MFPLLSFSTTRYSDTVLNSFLRWIVLVEVAQNAWSFSVNHPSDVTTSRRGSRKKSEGSESLPTKTAASLSSSSSISSRYVWGRSLNTNKDLRDEHRLEDIFLGAEGLTNVDALFAQGAQKDIQHHESSNFQEGSSLSLLDEDEYPFISSPPVRSE